MALIGYICPASYDPTGDVQRHAVEEAGAEVVHADEANGERRALQKCLMTAAAGDTLVVYGLDRLAHSTSGLIGLLDSLASRGVHLVSVSDLIDTRTETGVGLYRVVRLLLDSATRANEDKRKPVVMPALGADAGLPGKKARGRAQRDPEVLARGLALAKEPGANVLSVARALGRHRSNLYRFYPEIIEAIEAKKGGGDALP